MRPVGYWFSIALMGFSLLGSSWLQAHPFHICVGQMQWNKDANAWEVAIRLHPQDLEGAMKSKLGRVVASEDEDFPTLATEYLNENFFLLRTSANEDAASIGGWLKQRDARERQDSKRNYAELEADGARSVAKWVGMERERGWLWIYLELKEPEPKGNDAKYWMVHQLLIDQVEKQENSIAIEPGDRAKYSLQFRSQAVVRPFRK